jgi:hypothetical protein
MKCSNCGAAISAGAETHLLNCAFCGAVQRNPDAAERRPIDALLDEVFAETGDAAFSVKIESQEITVRSETVAGRKSTICEVDGRRYEADETPPEVKQTLRESRRALNDVFGREGDAARAPAPEPTEDAVVASAAVAEPPATPAVASPPTVTPTMEAPPLQRNRSPRVTLGAAPSDHPDFTRYLVPVLVVALLAGLGVAALTALILG